ncbi:MAG: FixH family protein [Pseudomonadota bacterium]
MIRRILGLDRFTGWHMAGVMVLFFGVIISVNLTLAVFANRSWTGLVVENSYVASQQFDDMIAERKAQAARGWHTALDYSGGQLHFAMTDAAGRALAGAEVRVRVGRPTHETDDLDIALVPVAGGYGAALALTPGAWDAWVEARSADGTPWEGQWRLWVERPR